MQILSFTPDRGDHLQADPARCPATADRPRPPASPPPKRSEEQLDHLTPIQSRTLRLAGWGAGRWRSPRRAIAATAEPPGSLTEFIHRLSDAVSD